MRRTFPVSLWAAAFLPGLLLATVAGDYDDAMAAGSRALSGGDLVAAERAFARAAEIDPRSVDALLNLGITRSRGRDYPGATAAYEALLEIDPRHAKALNNLANVWFRQDDYERAEVYYRRALESNPDYLYPLYHLGWIERHRNESESAQIRFRRCVELTPKSAREAALQIDCRFYLGSLRFRAEDYAETASLMEQVVAVYPAHPEARYYLAMALMRLGRREEALEQLSIHRQLLDAQRPAPIDPPDDPP